MIFWTEWLDIINPIESDVGITRDRPQGYRIWQISAKTVILGLVPRISSRTGISILLIKSTAVPRAILGTSPRMTVFTGVPLLRKSYAITLRRAGAEDFTKHPIMVPRDGLSSSGNRL